MMKRRKDANQGGHLRDFKLCICLNGVESARKSLHPHLAFANYSWSVALDYRSRPFMSTAWHLQMEYIGFRFLYLFSTVYIQLDRNEGLFPSLPLPKEFGDVDLIGVSRNWG